jgi:hypothetical protein
MSETTERTGVAHRLLTHLEDAYGVSVDDATEVQGGRTSLELVIDIGNSETYALAVRDGQLLKPIRLPSVKSMRGANMAALLAERGRPGDVSALSADEHIITTDGIDRFVGGLAITSSAYPTTARGSEARYADGWNLDFLYAAVGALSRGAEHITARVVTALPYGLWAPHQAEVQAALINGKKSHRFSYNGQPKQLIVREATVEREGHIAWWALPADWRQGTTLVLDWGGHTCNIVLVDNSGAVVPGRAMTQPVGCETILDDLSTELPRPLTLTERTGLLAALRDGQGAFVIGVGGQGLDIMARARARFADAARTFAQKLTATIPQQDRAMIGSVALVGGTAYTTANALRERLPVLKTLTKDHEFANLLGAAIRHGLIGAAKSKGKK